MTTTAAAAAAAAAAVAEDGSVESPGGGECAGGKTDETGLCAVCMEIEADTALRALRASLWMLPLLVGLLGGCALVGPGALSDVSGSGNLGCPHLPQLRASQGPRSARNAHPWPFGCLVGSEVLSAAMRAGSEASFG
eukprot:CAMPEP_0115575192 /NCGR_PEP_ID=MMETSP0272-20121206/1909_1 /TAXON_ID=71861 /ORGANISM="Scrippsiella trochoidea, Strain CCMP3099" /LENGTH=136 /DNA_ID=CAMNT_0003009923 /DNA_START=25 /DNA_END=431 /DNA_ORIENTATION=-